MSSKEKKKARRARHGDSGFGIALSDEEVSFRKAFPNVPVTERLVESCQCGLNKSIVRLGTMYLTAIRLCFTSSFLDKDVVILWDDITNLVKKTSIFFDSVHVTTKNKGDYSFSTFLTTGTTEVYTLMKTLFSSRERFNASESAGMGSSRGVSEAGSESGTEITSQSRSTSFVSHRGGSESPASPIVLPFSVVTSRVGDIEKEKDPGNDVNEEMRRHFPSLPETEKIKRVFQCSFVSGVLRLGKIALTDSFALFYSPMMEESVQVSFTDIESIEKERKMTILDSITIKVKGGKSVSFTNFISRDAFFNALEERFEQIKKTKEKTKEKEDEDADSGPLVFKTTTAENDISKLPTAATLNDFSSIVTQYGTALSNYTCFEKEVITPVEMPTGKTVMDVFGMCFDDGTPLLEKYHADRKDTDQKWENWRPVEGKSLCGQREFSCTTPVKAMMGKLYSYYEYERYALLNVGGTPTLMVQFSSQLPGVMFGTAFRSEALATFSQTGSGAEAKVTMRAFAYVQFLKSVLVKGRINSTTISELGEGYTKLSKMIFAVLSEGSVNAVKELEGAPAAVAVSESVPAPAGPAIPPQTAKERNAYVYVTIATSVCVVLVSSSSLIHTVFVSAPSQASDEAVSGARSAAAPSPRAYLYISLFCWRVRLCGCKQYHVRHFRITVMLISIIAERIFLFFVFCPGSEINFSFFLTHCFSLILAVAMYN
ncbi:hypothetical protein STCU_06890 [Strigomonas culicis]|uniref:VASt domain-containing protein n=1 Tax=Strigomonas culicis TaxID=28005 RepID=S9VDC9_9TRYP|nr:hypothetical protein STCU_06890 [Strigomonas culicis]|eukprot:EPY25006.1 hypothetical protein STCU_06890 [Strigomonas culicis]